MKQMKSTVLIAALALAFLAAPIAIRADELRIQSFDGTGALTFNRIPTGEAYRVECATSLTGAWSRLTNAVTIDGIPTTMDCIPGKGGIATGAVPVQASTMFFRAVAETNDMALIPAGAFVMDEGSYMPHEVYVSSFYMDRYHVTQAKSDSVYTWAINRPPDLQYIFTFLGYINNNKVATHPISGMCWYECLAWCNARSEMEGLTPCYTNADGSVYRKFICPYNPQQNPPPQPGCNWNANGYRLPTSAEWEKAARGGVTGHRFPWSDSDTIQHTRANYYANTNIPYDTSATIGYHPAYTNTGTSPVGSFAPNGYGLYDMAGNAEEWVWDELSAPYYAISPRINPRGPPQGLYSQKVIRNGGFEGRASSLIVTFRTYDNAYFQRCGFRTVKSSASNHLPIIAEGASVNVTMSEDGTPTSFSLTLHATDEDNDLVGWVVFAASHGTVTPYGSGASMPIAYTPAANYNGSDTFVAQAYDIWGATASITVNVTIQPVNDAPVANAQFVSVALNTPQAITLTGSDPVEGSAITYEVVASPVHGTLTGNAPNVTYTPQINYAGYDSFTFRVNDGTDDSAPATVTIFVGAKGGAQGGTLTNYTANGTNYIAHIFTTVGSTSLTVAAGGEMEVLLVAGGGGGGGGDYRGIGGGGGAGGLIYTNLMLVTGTYAVTVGAGGVAGSYSDTATPGSNSTFAGLTALGGGCAKLFTNGVAGGSGAGGYGKSYVGGAGNQPGGYGNNGGAGGAGPGGGGGGAGGAGGAGSVGVINSVGGNGGIGRSYDISGVLTGYAGGGGGGAQVGSGGTATDGGGRGADGGNQGGYNVAGSSNTGGGGGGGFCGAAGGSGIVIVRYVIAVP